ncbi:MAG: S8 family serine peptidase [Verrucomicrobiia bacterium]
MRIGLWIILAVACVNLVLERAQAAAPRPASPSAHFQFREPTPAGYCVELPSPAEALLRAASVKGWLTAWPDNGSPNFVQFGDRIVLQLTSPADLEDVLRERPVLLARTVGETVFILQAADAPAALREAQSLAADPRVSACYPVTRRQKQLYGPYAHRPNDPFFYLADGSRTEWQAHLENRDSEGTPSGIDLNVRAAWPFSRGEGVLVALADDGFELNHPDLRDRAEGSPHFNFLNDNSSGEPSGVFSNHGTAVAGLIAATADNGKGIAGVAPRAQLASWVIFGSSDQLASEEALMDMFQFSSNVVHVQNHSWGKVGTEQLRLALLEDLAISNAVRFGRSGRGSIIVRAGGNGRGDGNDANDDGYAADPRVIAVAAARLDGRATRYSSPGACLLVAAPSGDVGDAVDPCLSDTPNMTTTDRQGSRGYNSDTSSEGGGDYAFGGSGFSGTSAATPQIAGLAALILSVNPRLGYRDVQQILALSGRLPGLSDPTLATNGAGFQVSHNLGFGIPDAGMAVSLARTWSNRPASVTVTYTNQPRAEIPDQSLRIVVEGDSVPESIRSIVALPGAGPHPDQVTAWLPLVDAGSATNAISLDLRGQAALIQRGVNYFCEKVEYASLAGAEFAIVYNNRDGEARLFMAETDFSSIPSVFINQTDGDALRDYLAESPGTQVRCTVEAAEFTFDVAATLQCEFIGLRLDTDHTARGDLRIVLESPAGTRSVLQRSNQDAIPGPRNWTYYSVQHFFESSFGRWTVRVYDEDIKGTGAIRRATLIVSGVPLEDSDHDSLDDRWEQTQFGDLAYGAADDPDHDGTSNAREQILGTSPLARDIPFQLDLSVWDSRLVRLSWPSDTNTAYRVQIGPETVAPLTLVTNLPGRFYETEWFVPYTNLLHQFFQVQAVPADN